MAVGARADDLPGDFDTTSYFLAGAQQAVMVNFSVHEIEPAMVPRLKAAGAAGDDQIEVDPGAGRFAWLTDPGSNKVQLWEPESQPQRRLRGDWASQQ